MKITTTHLIFAGIAIALAVQAPKFFNENKLSAAVESQRSERKQKEKLLNEESSNALTLARSCYRAVLPGQKEGGLEAPISVGMEVFDPQTQQRFAGGTRVCSKFGDVGVIGADGLISEVFKVATIDRESYQAILKEVEEFRTSAGVNGKDVQPTPIPEVIEGVQKDPDNTFIELNKQVPGS